MGRTIELKFPLTNGGKETGFNDSGIETFLGRPHYYIARECGQNVGDVARQEINTVELRFELLNIPRKKLPCIDQLKSAIEASNEFIKDPKGKRFFEQALKSIRKDKISVLKISDYGTTGLIGDDDDRDGGWYGLVRSEGVTNKYDGDKGGGFGIGKYAVFAGSGFRTVLYSTKTEDGKLGFQGVSHLVSHRDENHITQGTGYIGHYDDNELKFSAVRENSLIPELLKREEVGLDIYVLDFLHKNSWEETLTKSILENFWPAIFFEKIKFIVGNIEVNKNTLSKLMNHFSSDEDFEAFYHYQSVISPEKKHFTKELPYLGKVDLYLVPGGNERYPKSIALVRKSGMVIDKRKTRSRVPYAGLFICNDPEGNKLLKSMEPPRHDEFQPERAPGVGQKVIRNLYKWLSECVKTLNPILNTDTLEIPDLYKYLPDPTDEDIGYEENDSNKQSEESFNKTVNENKPEISSFATLTVHSVKIDSTDEDGTSGAGKKDSNEDDESGEGPSIGSGTGEDQGDNEGENEGKNQTKGSNRIIQIKTRTIPSQDETYPLTICLRPEETFEGKLLLYGVGEDGAEIPLEIGTAILSSNSDELLTLENGNTISNIHLSKSEPARIKLSMNSSERVAIKVTGRTI